jgi:dihydrofolate synthase/folylpolyglutamate synthase
MRLTFFETLTGMAFAAFADAPVDVAVLEVGLGGSWDATNVADADVAVIMPIDLDHTRLLGSSPAEIAHEKAGIIKRGSVAVVAPQSPDVLDVIAARCADVGAEMLLAGRDFGLLERSLAVGGQVLRLQGVSDVYDEVILPIHGAHQAENAAVALAAVEVFLGAAGQGRTIDADVVREGFAMADSPARLEVLRTGPTIVIDAAHNPHGAQATAAALAETFAFDRLIGVFACSVEKDVAGILQAFEGQLDNAIVTENSTTRTMPIAELAEVATAVFGEDRVLVEPIFADALTRAVDLADEGGIGGAGIIVTGSVYTAAQARVLLGTPSDSAE